MKNKVYRERVQWARILNKSNPELKKFLDTQQKEWSGGRIPPLFKKVALAHLLNDATAILNPEDMIYGTGYHPMAILNGMKSDLAYLLQILKDHGIVKSSVTKESIYVRAQEMLDSIEASRKKKCPF